jgi:Pectate lyase superfamily protein
MPIDAVNDLGLDPTGKTDCSPDLENYLNSSSAAGSEIRVPRGTYRFNSTVETNAKNVRIVGEGVLARMGDSPTVFFTDKKMDAILWWNGSQSNANMNGPWIERIQFQDRSGSHNVLRSAVKLTATANSELEIGFQNLRPRRETEGKVSVTLQSKSVTGSGTHWDPCMVPCGWIVIDGYPYEIASIDSPTKLTMAIAWQSATGSNKGFAINWGGVGVHCDPGTDYTQYGTHWSLDGRCGCALFASAGQISPRYTGTSRIKVLSGYLNGEGIPDSMACYLGPYSDTFRWDVAMNSYAYAVVIANGHQHDIQHLDAENAGGPVPVTGRPAEYGSCYGVLVMSSNSSDTWGNRIGGYFRQVGTGIEFYGADGKAPTWSVIGACTGRSNNNPAYVPGHATKTIGAELYAQPGSFHAPDEGV